MILFLADMLLVMHALFVVFVVGGQAAIMMGAWRGWAWVRNWYFRLCHVMAIGVVVLQSWLGMWCLLTVWEDALRRSQGVAGYQTGFIAHWLHRVMFFEAPLWVFSLVYTVFGGLVVAYWFIARPAR